MINSNEQRMINKEYEKAITLYDCVESFIKLLEIKIYKARLENRSITKYKDGISLLKEYKLYVEANVDNSILEQLHLFKTENKVLADRLGIRVNKIFETKKSIRDRFVPIYEANKDLIKSFL